MRPFPGIVIGSKNRSHPLPKVYENDHMKTLLLIALCAASAACRSSPAPAPATSAEDRSPWTAARISPDFSGFVHVEQSPEGEWSVDRKPCRDFRHMIREVEAHGKRPVMIGVSKLGFPENADLDRAAQALHSLGYAVVFHQARGAIDYLVNGKGVSVGKYLDSKLPPSAMVISPVEIRSEGLRFGG